MEIDLEKYHLKSVALSDLLSAEELRRVKARMQRKEYSKGENLFKEHSYSKGVYVVRKGKVKIFQTNAEGKQSIVYIYRKGDFFGYRPVLAAEPHPVSATAMDSVVVSFIPKDIFLQLLEQSPSLALKIAVGLAKEFSVWINKMTVFSQYSVKERVALSLLILNQVYSRSNAARHTLISINRDDFAGFVGTAKETLVRMLRVFKDEGIIAARGTHITLTRPKALKQLVASL